MLTSSLPKPQNTMEDMPGTATLNLTIIQDDRELAARLTRLEDEVKRMRCERDTLAPILRRALLMMVAALEDWAGMDRAKRKEEQ